MTDPFHGGEIEAQFRFNEDWSEGKKSRLASIYRQAVDDEMALFIEGVQFFFLATADKDGHCDCSFKGTEPGSDGELAPAIHVIDSRTLVFPDYAGNKMFNSVGNLLTNPHVGLLFIDFPAQLRLRVNGSAVVESPGEFLRLWPEAKRLIKVSVEQVYWNCPKRIPTDPQLKKASKGNGWRRMSDA